MAMYADGHLASVEDARVQRWLATIGLDTDYDRNQQFDASVTRVRRHSQPSEVAARHVAMLAREFATPEQRQCVHDLLEDLLKSDNQVAAPENVFLSVVRNGFQL